MSWLDAKPKEPADLLRTFLDYLDVLEVILPAAHWYDLTAKRFAESAWNDALGGLAWSIRKSPLGREAKDAHVL